MKILVLVLDGLEPSLLLNDERLTTFRNLMEFGCYGRLKGVDTSHSVPAWMCMAASQSPESIETGSALTIWEQLALGGKQPYVFGPPIGSDEEIYVQPVSLRTELPAGMFPSALDPSTFENEEHLRDEIATICGRQFDAAKQLIQKNDWDFIQFMPTGLEMMQRHFWRHHDSAHDLYEPDDRLEVFVGDFYQVLDSEVEQILELLDEDTAVMVVSTKGSTLADGDDLGKAGFFILAAMGNPLDGEIEGVHLLDLAPTLLAMGEYKIPPTMQGRCLLPEMMDHAIDGSLSAEEEELLRERLSGLGYIS